ncbi:MAG: hypothetical protein F6J98_21680 [Moorea sp. SIO4G2]|nr:hypothetical protein [Moorena sp. SIO4A3]NEO62903.1 hypothetical protein [Moorena sp. SIO4G2]
MLETFIHYFIYCERSAVSSQRSAVSEQRSAVSRHLKINLFRENLIVQD